jgi:nitroreductase
MENYAARVAAARAQLSERPDLLDLVRYATLAANGHNTQPWRFRPAEGRIAIIPDFARRTSVVDPDDHHLFASLGCAAENLAIAVAARGRRGDLRFDLSGNGTVVFEFGAGPREHSVLFEAIPERQSTRAEYDGRAVATADLEALAAAGRIPGVDLILVSDRRQVERVLDLVVAGNTAQMADPAFVHELKRWLRFNPRQALETGDGLFSAASGNPTAPAWLGGLLFDLLFRATTENDKYARQLRSSAGVAIFVSERDDKDHWVRAGRACQRFALQATALGLRHAFVNQPVEVAALRPQLASLVGMSDRRPDMVMRFGHGPRLPFSPRRPVEAVLAPADA